MDKILVLDPGNSTGCLMREADGTLYGTTIVENHEKIGALIESFHPDKIIYETFQLYPSKAQKMCWNSFYPVEVIGIIRFLAARLRIEVIGLQPSVKKFSLDLKDWKSLKTESKITEHIKDAYRLYDYWRRNYERNP